LDNSSAISFNLSLVLATKIKSYHFVANCLANSAPNPLDAQVINAFIKKYFKNKKLYKK
jgi:hypothetical protein